MKLADKEVAELKELQRLIYDELSILCKSHLEGRPFLAEFSDLILADLENVKAIGANLNRHEFKQVLRCLEMLLVDGYAMHGLYRCVSETATVSIVFLRRISR